MLRPRSLLYISGILSFVLLSAHFRMQCWRFNHFLSVSKFFSPFSTTQFPANTAKMGIMGALDLLTLDESELQLLIKEGSLTSVSPVEQLLAQIAREDQAGANLRAMLSVGPKNLLLSTAPVGWGTQRGQIAWSTSWNSRSRHGELLHSCPERTC
jgi:hypothetical protein